MLIFVVVVVVVVAVVVVVVEQKTHIRTYCENQKPVYMHLHDVAAGLMVQGTPPLVMVPKKMQTKSQELYLRKTTRSFLSFTPISRSPCVMHFERLSTSQNLYDDPLIPSIYQEWEIT